MSSPKSRKGARRVAGVDPTTVRRVRDLTHRYVDEGVLAGAHVRVTRRGVTVVDDVYGLADLATSRALAGDAIYRIFSMTKPIVSLALMQLYEQGKFLLEHPVARYLPEFEGLQVFTGAGGNSRTGAPERPVDVRDLLTHQSGLSLTPPWEDAELLSLLPHAELADLQALVTRLSAMPLLFQPGARFDYGISTDVVGRLVEVLSGKPLDRYLADHVLGPLGMADTGFWVPPDKAKRLASVYARGPDGLVVAPQLPIDHLCEQSYFSGVGGLVSSAADYQRFCDMLLAGGSSGGERLIGRKTLALMRTNHLSSNRDLRSQWGPAHSQPWMAGVGFGLGFSVVTELSEVSVTCSLGQFGWGGFASTYFWTDPAEQVTALLMTQFVPSDALEIRRELQVAVYQSLVD